MKTAEEITIKIAGILTKKFPTIQIIGQDSGNIRCDINKPGIDLSLVKSKLEKMFDDDKELEEKEVFENFITFHFHDGFCSVIATRMVPTNHLLITVISHADQEP